MKRLPATVDDLRGLRAARVDTRVDHGPVRPLRPGGTGGAAGWRRRASRPASTQVPSGASLTVAAPSIAALPWRRCWRPRPPVPSTSCSSAMSAVGSATCARRSTCSKTSCTQPALPSGSATNRSCPALSATGTSSWPKQPTPSATRAGWPDASARATQASSPSSATQEAGPRSASGGTSGSSSNRSPSNSTPYARCSSSQQPGSPIAKSRTRPGSAVHGARHAQQPALRRSPARRLRCPLAADHSARNVGRRTGSPRDSTHPRRSSGHASDLRAIDAPMLSVWSQAYRGHRPLPPHGAVRGLHRCLPRSGQGDTRAAPPYAWSQLPGRRV